MTKHGTGMRAEVGEDLHINMAGIALLVRCWCVVGAFRPGDVYYSLTRSQAGKAAMRVRKPTRTIACTQRKEGIRPCASISIR